MGFSAKETSFPTRKLGSNGPYVTAIGWGSMGLASDIYGLKASDEERLRFLDQVHEKGGLFWDTSDSYGDAEDLLGAWFKKTGKRSEIFLATKFGSVKDKNGVNTPNSSAEYAKQACQRSLERLGVDYIDLFYLHRASEGVPIEQTMRALVELKREGKIKYIGLSEVDDVTLRRACNVHHVDALQIEYSICTPDIESEKGCNLLQTARELGVAIIAYSPLCRGLSTGNYTKHDQFSAGDVRNTLPRFSEENLPKNLELISKLSEVAQRRSCSLVQLSLAWLLAQGEDIIPIPGTKKIKYLDDNFEAFKVQLTQQDLEDIRDAMSTTEIVGSRYPEASMNLLLRRTREE
ncbi:unnamed protein product [Clonostachys chloroleuca]|uniref:NADP-dependent oxidoreductase domain-containing protein n=1 Tax=Clonostachys chloroleuca TaxID=1926264 RepID=A0AA35PZA8_9HYPO|nr:unnamed protein product [Clonostachys chloroleuca]